MVDAKVLSYRHAVRLARSGQVFDSADFHSLLSHPSQEVRVATVLFHHDLPECFVVVAACDAMAVVRMVAASHKNLPIERMNILARDNDSDVRCAIANRHDITEEAIDCLQYDTNTIVQVALFANPSVLRECKEGLLVRNIKSASNRYLLALAAQDDLFFLKYEEALRVVGVDRRTLSYLHRNSGNKAVAQQ